MQIKKANIQTILLIHAKINYDAVEPFGILTLGTYLQSFGFSIHLLEIFPNDHSGYIIERIKKINPDLIGYSIETVTLSRIKGFNPLLQQVFPNVYFCAGGIHPTALPMETLQDLNLDFIIQGEAEACLRDVIETMNNHRSWKHIPGVVTQDDGEMIDNGLAVPLASLEEIPQLDRNLIKPYNYYLSPPSFFRGRVYNKIANLLVSRGCPYKCIYCGSHKIFKRKVRHRKVESVIEEILFLKEHYGIKGFAFLDDLITIRKSWVLQLSQKLIEHKINMKWVCQARADSLDEEMVIAMKESGCYQVDIGVESASQPILDRLQKQTTVEKLENGFDLLKKYKIRRLATFILGAPGETLDDINKDVEFIKRVQPDMTQFFYLVPYPGSQLFDELNPKEKQTLRDFDESWCMKSSSQTVLETSIDYDTFKELRGKLEGLNPLSTYLPYIYGWFKYPFHLFIFISGLFRYRQQLFKQWKKSRKEGRLYYVLEEAYSSYKKNVLRYYKKKAD